MAHKKNIHHEYISTKQYNNALVYRLFNFLVLLFMMAADRFLHFSFSDYSYVIVFAALMGYDVPSIIKTIKAKVGRK